MYLSYIIKIYSNLPNLKVWDTCEYMLNVILLLKYFLMLINCNKQKALIGWWATLCRVLLSKILGQLELTTISLTSVAVLKSLICFLSPLSFKPCTTLLKSPLYKLDDMIHFIGQRFSDLRYLLWLVLKINVGSTFVASNVPSRALSYYIWYL